MKRKSGSGGLRGKGEEDSEWRGGKIGKKWLGWGVETGREGNEKENWELKSIKAKFPKSWAHISFSLEGKTKQNKTNKLTN